MKIGVFVEKNPVTGKVREVSLELCSKASALVEPFDGEVVGIYADEKLPSDYESLFSVGLDRLVFSRNGNLKYAQALALKNIVEKIIVKEDPEMVLFGATSLGREIAPLISSSLQTGLTADCTQLYIDEYKESGKILYQVRPAFGGNILATIVAPGHRPVMSTVREGVMKLPEKLSGNEVSVEEFNVETESSWFPNEFLKILPKERRVNFNRSNIIVAGGAGVGSRENFRLLRNLAEMLGAELGGSRAAVDSGFIDKNRQIGQTGAVVRPKLYLAFGISGSIQHRAGMDESSKIIAVNTDPDAPIFGISHFGIVEDLKTVIPVMMRYLKEDVNG